MTSAEVEAKMERRMILQNQRVIMEAMLAIATNPKNIPQSIISDLLFHTARAMAYTSEKKR